MNRFSLALHFVRRELHERYRGSFTGFGWAFLQPLLQLAIYAFVFVQIFKARIPGAGAPGYVPFLVVGLWPWIAFSDAILRSTTALQDNSALIGKVAVPREILVFAPCAAGFMLHLAGFIVILLVLALTGQGIRIQGIPFAILMYLPMFLYAYGAALCFAALQVFVRDLVQILGQLLTLMMFAAPIFYDRSNLPDRYQGWLDLNPFTGFVEAYRFLLLGHGNFGWGALGLVLAIAVISYLVGSWLFRRLDPHFEDFL
ncbi:MAG TPA: ABC transporter permease [Dokdonella sp.]|jgi:lipopolysaccharide transport system permease protein|uniref:ABC transporter permease n=1 Tax=Dokdonella sp. TaxID=2291710 RepID=UPI002C93C0A3|nr:ABC transporter permease [Dokdonella sp.]HNV08164.1 ABC transporter permease [Dokdonella sp.]HPW03629.1 ABC transporter permease [Dokdonella sp.]